MPTDSFPDDRDPSSQESSNDDSSREAHQKAQESAAMEVQDPPNTIGGIVRRLGPGLIVAGSIVGSGELIATTSTGAQAGFWLLWLILIGCVIKVFVQVEFGRFAITTGKTTMEALSEVPGPRIRNRGNWLIWYWFIMFVASIAQLGGIVGGVGQALSISAPLTSYGSSYNDFADAETQLIVLHSQLGSAVRPNPNSDDSSRWIVDSIEASQAKDLYRQEMISLSIRAELAQAGEDAPSAELGAEVAAILETIETMGSDLDEANREARVGELFWIGYQLHVRLAEELANVQANLDERSGNLEALQSRKRELEEQAVVLREAFATQAESLSATSGSEMTESYEAIRNGPALEVPIDDKIWAGIIAVLTAIILINGRFGLIQSFSTAMVASFTAITIVNLLMLQSNATWGVSVQDIVDGLKFRLPPSTGGNSSKAITTALQTFGIIGVGATELIVYPYWCLEKGYGRYIGPRDGSTAWVERAKGWLRVMRWDAWCSMVVYTFATVAFYLLGAAILCRSGLEPAGAQLIRYLAVMYEPVFGETARLLFLFGAFAVLYSTFFVANASHARVFSDALRIMGIAPRGEQTYRLLIRVFSGVFPLLCFVIYVFIPKPTQLVLLSGLMQAVMLPMLAVAALFFRYRRIDDPLKPTLIWDVFLWISAVGMFIAGVWAAWSKLAG